jgi:polysaccharide biosynthesis protein VpsM
MKLKCLTLLVILLFSVAGALHAKETTSLRPSKKHSHKKIAPDSSKQLLQVSSFINKKNAESLVRKLRREGQIAVIRKGVGKNKKAIYRVFVKKKKSTPVALGDSPKREDIGSGKTGDDAAAFESNRAEAAQPGAADVYVRHPEPVADSVPAGEVRQVALLRFAESKEDADRLSNQLRDEGYSVTIRKKAAKDDRKVYSVFAQSLGAVNSEVSVSPVGVTPVASSEKPSPEDVSAVRETPPPVLHENKDSVTTQQSMPGPETAVEKRPSEAEKAIAQMLAAKESKEAASAGEIRPQPSGLQPRAEEIPVGSSKGRVSSEVFGGKGGYVHPFLGITEYYSDNIFNTRNDKVSDFTTVFSPGVWLTVPHVYEKLLNIDTSNVSPGGYTLSRYNPETFTRYQAYLYYNADIEFHTRESAGNAVNHRAEGLFQYNLRGGLTFELMDQFLASHDMWGTGLAGKKLDKFRTNLADLMIVYDTENRLKFRLDYSYNLVDYLAARNSFRDRSDNSFSAYIFYKVKPKTSVFYEYELVDIDYRDSVLSNSIEHHNFVGIQWDVTAKSKGSVKAGYGLKNFSDSDVSDASNFIVEGQVDHKLTAKTSLILKASRRTEETNISTTGYVLSDSISAEYLQRLTGKITLDAMLSYTRDKYFGDLTLDGTTKQLKDNYYLGMLALQYKFREWLQLDSGYLLNTRDSNFTDLDYTSNIIFLRITGSL